MLSLYAYNYFSLLSDFFLLSFTPAVLYNFFTGQALSASGHHQGEGFVGDRLILPAPTNMPPTQAAATANDLAILNNIRESQVKVEISS
jgi:hypothetical protein